MRKIVDEELISDIMFIKFRGYPESMCEDGRDAFYKLERYVLKELEPYLNEEFEVELQGYVKYKFQAYSYSGEALNWASLDKIRKID